MFPFLKRKPCQYFRVPRTAADVILVDKFAVLRCVISAVGISVFDIEDPLDAARIDALFRKKFCSDDKIQRLIRILSAEKRRRTV